MMTKSLSLVIAATIAIMAVLIVSSSSVAVTSIYAAKGGVIDKGGNGADVARAPHTPIGDNVIIVQTPGEDNSGRGGLLSVHNRDLGTTTGEGGADVQTSTIDPFGKPLECRGVVTPSGSGNAACHPTPP